MAKIFHVTEVTEGQPKNLNLCQNCVEGYLATTGGAAVLNKPFQPTAPIIEKLLGLLKHKSLTMPKPPNPTVPVEAEILCDKCSTGITDIFKGKLGCPECYAHFEAQLKGILTNIHGSITHVGKVPKKYQEQYNKEIAEQFFNHDTTIVASNYTIQQHVVTLQEVLTAAVKEEKYEIAGKCKKAIEEIEFLKCQKGVLDCEFMNAALRKDIEAAKSVKEQIQKCVSMCLQQKVI
jgi:protein-arginine kinase activator protein McsA